MPLLVKPARTAERVFGRQQPELPAGELTLRPWRPDDVPALMTAFADPEIQRWHLRRLDSAEEAVDLVRAWHHGWRQGTGASWAVVHQVDPAAVLGQVGFRALYLDAGMAEVSYWVMPERRGSKVASRAAAALADWALADLGLERLELVHSTQNPVSCSVAGRAGFEVEGTKRRLQQHADGWHDMHLHSRIR